MVWCGVVLADGASDGSMQVSTAPHGNHACVQFPLPKPINRLRTALDHYEILDVTTSGAVGTDLCTRLLIECIHRAMVPSWIIWG